MTVEPDEHDDLLRMLAEAVADFAPPDAVAVRRHRDACAGFAREDWPGVAAMGWLHALQPGAELPGEGPVRIEMSANLPLLQTWTQAGADFLCLEPFGGMPNAVNQPDAPTVPPGGATRWWMRILV